MRTPKKKMKKLVVYKYTKDDLALEHWHTTTLARAWELQLVGLKKAAEELRNLANLMVR